MPENDANVAANGSTATMAQPATAQYLQSPPSVHPDFLKPPATAAQATQQPQPSATPAPPTSAEPTPHTVPITLQELQRYASLEAQLAQVQRDRQAEVDMKEGERIKALAEAGQIKEALKAQESLWQQRENDAKQKLANLERQWSDEKAEVVLVSALNGRNFAGATDAERQAAAGMLKTILRGEIEAVRNVDGSVMVKDKASGRPAADVLNERISAPALAFFFAPQSRGGSGSDGTRPPAHQETPMAGSLDAIAAQYKANQGQHPSMGLSPVGKTH